MKQLFRLFLRPATFVNQLQWSTHHGLILLAFLGVAALESQVGTGRALNEQLAWLLQRWTPIQRDHALVVVTAGRILFLFFGTLSLSETIWWIGEKLGRSTSKRVLNRRMAVVFTVMLASYALLVATEPSQQWFGALLFMWGLTLCFWTLKEQFSLSALSAGVLGIVAAVVIVATWQVSDRFVQKAVGHAIAAKAPSHAKPSRRH